MVGILKQFLGSDKYTTIENPEILWETDKAFNIEYNEQRAWLPKSQIIIDQDEGESLRITIPDWIFKKKFA